METVDLDQKRILVVEDNPVNQMVAKRFLKKWGGEVVIAENGLDALQKLEEGAFHLVLMDIQMPQMDGHACTQRIRSHERDSVKNLPIIALTGDHDESTVNAVLQAGMNDHLTKPLNPARLSAVLEKHLAI